MEKNGTKRERERRRGVEFQSQSHANQFVMGRREGCRLNDLDGSRSLYNLHCNGGVFNLGHRSPALLSHLSTLDVDIGNHHLLSAHRAALARAMATLSPGGGAMRWSVFGVSGGEAVDLAVKLCWAYTQRRKIIVAEGVRGWRLHFGSGVFDFLSPLFSFFSLE